MLRDAHLESVERKREPFAKRLDKRLLPSPTAEKRGEPLRFWKRLERCDFGRCEEPARQVEYFNPPMPLEINADFDSTCNREHRPLAGVRQVEANILACVYEVRLAPRADRKAQRLGRAIQVAAESESRPSVRDNEPTAVALEDEPRCSLALVPIEQRDCTVYRRIETNADDVNDLAPAFEPVRIASAAGAGFTADPAQPTDPSQWRRGLASETFPPK